MNNTNYRVIPYDDKGEVLLYKAMSKAVSEAFWDAVLVDLRTYITIYGISYGAVSLGLITAGGPFAIPAASILYGTLGAFAGYTIRKTCKDYSYEGKHSVICGMVGNGIKYGIKANPLTIDKEMFIGAVNGSLYEGLGDYIDQNVKNEETAYLFTTIFGIENVDTILGKFIMNKDLFSESAVNSVASVFLTFFISVEEWNKEKIQVGNNGRFIGEIEGITPFYGTDYQAMPYDDKGKLLPYSETGFDDL